MNKKGFTLIETIIYIAIVGAVLTSFIFLAMSAARIRNKNYAIQEVQANGRVALQVMEQKIRSATDVVDPVGGATGNQLVLQMPVGPNITFAVVSGTLQMTVTGSSAIFLSDSRVQVENLSFTNISSSNTRDNILITATVSYRAEAGDLAYTYSEQLRTAVGLRK